MCADVGEVTILLRAMKSGDATAGEGSVALTGADAAYLRRYRSCSNIEQLVDESDLACDFGLA